MTKVFANKDSESDISYQAGYEMTILHEAHFFIRLIFE